MNIIETTVRKIVISEIDEIPDIQIYAPEKFCRKFNHVIIFCGMNIWAEELSGKHAETVESYFSIFDADHLAHIFSSELEKISMPAYNALVRIIEVAQKGLNQLEKSKLQKINQAEEALK